MRSRNIGLATGTLGEAVYLAHSQRREFPFPRPNRNLTGFGDDFNDNSFDTAKWTKTANVFEQNGRLEFAVLSESASSVARYNFTNKQIIFRHFIGNVTNSLFFRFYHDAGNTKYLDIRIQPNAAIFRMTIHDTSDVHTDVSYNSLTTSSSSVDPFSFTKVNHRSDTNKWEIWRSQSVNNKPFAWTLLASLTPPAAVTSILLQMISTGSGTPSMYFDEISSDL